MKLPAHTKRTLLLTGIILSGPVFLLTTRPSSLPLPFLIVPYVWLFVVMYLAAGWLWDRLAFLRRHQVKKRLACGIAAALPLSLLLLQSIHQLSVRDVILVVGLGVISILYLGRLDLPETPKA